MAPAEPTPFSRDAKFACPSMIVDDLIRIAMEDAGERRDLAKTAFSLATRDRRASPQTRTQLVFRPQGLSCTLEVEL